MIWKSAGSSGQVMSLLHNAEKMNFPCKGTGSKAVAVPADIEQMVRVRPRGIVQFGPAGEAVEAVGVGQQCGILRKNVLYVP